MGNVMRFQELLRRSCQRIVTNVAGSYRIFKDRKSRVQTSSTAILPICYLQNLAALFLIGAGLCMIFLDEPCHYWRETLPVGFLNTFGWLNGLGNSAWLLIGSGVLCLVLLSQNSRKYGLRLRMALYSTFIYSAFLFYTVAASGLLVILIKWPLGRARPKLFDKVGAFHFDPLIFKAAYSSFPSGHATTVGATVVALSLIFPSWRAFIVATGFWVAISRVIWGAHYPSDAYTGVLLGAAFSYYSARVLARRQIGFKLSKDGRLRRSLGVSSARQCRHVMGNMLKKRKNGSAQTSPCAQDIVAQPPAPLRSRN